MKTAGSGARRLLLPLSLLGLLLCAAVALRLAGVDAALDVGTLARHEAAITAAVAAHPWLAPLAFAVLYALVVAVSLPGAAVLTMAGGWLFGTVFGTLWSALGATLGATLVFLLARGALREPLRRRVGARMAGLERAFREHGPSWLLFLRLVPLFPFWLVNLVPAFLGMRLLPYVACTFVGILPAGLVYAAIGAGLGDLLARGERPDPALILEPRFLLPLFGLGLLALAPVLWRRLRGGRGGTLTPPAGCPSSGTSPAEGA